MEKLSMEELKVALECGILEEDSIREQLDNMEKEKYLAMHPYEIFFSAGSWWTYLPSEEKGRVAKKRKKKEDLEKLIVNFYKEETENPTIKEVFVKWNTDRLNRGDIKGSTYDRDCQFFNRHFGEFGEKRIKNVSPKEWGEFWQEEIAKHNLSHKAFEGLRGVSYGILKKAKINGYISFSKNEPMDYVEFYKGTFTEKEKNDSDEVFNEEELHKLFIYLLENLDSRNLGILLMLLTGMRVGEVAALKRSDIGRNSIKVNASETRKKVPDGYLYLVGEVKTKAGKREVVLPDGCEWICEKLKRLNSNEEFVFVENGERLHTQAFRRRQVRILKKLGIKQKSCHKCRKTYATILCDKRFDMNLILRQMGHTDIGTTEGSYHKDRKEIELKAKILGTIEEFDLVKRA